MLRQPQICLHLLRLAPAPQTISNSILPQRSGHSLYALDNLPFTHCQKTCIAALTSLPLVIPGGRVWFGAQRQCTNAGNRSGLNYCGRQPLVRHIHRHGRYWRSLRETWKSEVSVFIALPAQSVPDSWVKIEIQDHPYLTKSFLDCLKRIDATRKTDLLISKSRNLERAIVTSGTIFGKRKRLAKSNRYVHLVTI